jgi:energy-coupling factor transporter ATP-binding protein EcfA2
MGRMGPAFGARRCNETLLEYNNFQAGQKGPSREGKTMKLERVLIRNFRSIERMELTFKDELDLIRECLPIVGPNTSGKTSILDAIALALMPATELYQFRDGLRLSPPALVRSGAVKASVSCCVWFSDDEIEATKEVMLRTGNPYNRQVPSGNRVTIDWTYPDPQGRHWTGYYRCDPDDGWLLFRGRKILAKNLHVPGLGSRHFQRLGSVVVFDQQRTGLSKRLSYYERTQLGQLMNQDRPGDYNGEDERDAEELEAVGRVQQSGFGHTTDPRLILTSLAMRAQVEQDPEATEREVFERLRVLYERVCHPHRIAGLYNTEHGLDMEFTGERGGRYYYDGLSSGQQMILLMLLQFATKRIHRSIVLIDELELHLHPLWQDRLYTSLGKLGDENQCIFTTHSTHLRDTIREKSYSTGELSSTMASS